MNEATCRLSAGGFVCFCAIATPLAIRVDREPSPPIWTGNLPKPGCRSAVGGLIRGREHTVAGVPPLTPAQGRHLGARFALPGVE
jgi:hypothetical protein